MQNDVFMVKSIFLKNIKTYIGNLQSVTTKADECKPVSCKLMTVET